jgi:hypothetical protein
MHFLVKCLYKKKKTLVMDYISQTVVFFFQSNSIITNTKGVVKNLLGGQTIINSYLVLF